MFFTEVCQLVHLGHIKVHHYCISIGFGELTEANTHLCHFFTLSSLWGVVLPSLVIHVLVPGLFTDLIIVIILIIIILCSLIITLAIIHYFRAICLHHLHCRIEVFLGLHHLHPLPSHDIHLQDIQLVPWAGKYLSVVISWLSFQTDPFESRCFYQIIHGILDAVNVKGHLTDLPSQAAHDVPMPLFPMLHSTRTSTGNEHHVHRFHPYTLTQ